MFAAGLPTIEAMPPNAGSLHAVLTDPGAVGTWNLAGARSSVRFTSRTLWGLIPVNGRFTDVRGHAHVGDDGSLSARIIIGVASVRTGITMRDKHLQAADFFDADRHPDITVEVTGGRGADLSATMSIRGTTLPVPLRASVDQLPDGAVRVTAHADIDRTDWNVSGNMAGMMPPQTVLAADVVFTRASGPASG